MTESFLPRDVRFLRSVRPFFFLVDIGFLLYWTVTGLHALPAAYLYKDYLDPLLTAWNLSFAPLDLAVSATGLGSLFLLLYPWFFLVRLFRPAGSLIGRLGAVGS